MMTHHHHDSLEKKLIVLFIIGRNIIKLISNQDKKKNVLFNVTINCLRMFDLLCVPFRRQYRQALKSLKG